MYYWYTDFICLYFLKFFHRVLGVVIVDYINPFFGSRHESEKWLWYIPGVIISNDKESKKIPASNSQRVALPCDIVKPKLPLKLASNRRFNME